MPMSKLHLFALFWQCCVSLGSGDLDTLGGGPASWVVVGFGFGFNGIGMFGHDTVRAFRTGLSGLE